MLHSITGVITAIKKQSIALQAAPFTFELLTAQPHSFELGQQYTIVTHLHWNQEQGPSFFGFNSELEKETFLLIISCSGIGPKMGLAALATLEPAIFLQAVASQDIKTLSSVSGIGAKKAEQICLHLKDKVEALLLSNPTLATASLSVFKDVQETLQSLNYSPAEIKQSIQIIKNDPTLPPTPTFDLLLRKALSVLSK